MALPIKHVRINGRNYTIAEVDSIVYEEEEQLGLCDVVRHTIQIATGPDNVMKDTVFHEIIHAACPTLTEEQVLDVERNLFAVLSDNKALTKWLFK